MNDKYKTPITWDEMPAVVYDYNDVYATRLLKREHQQIEEKLEKIKNWCESSQDVHTKPDLQKARRILEENGISLDSIAKDCMRHIQKELQKFIEKEK